MAFADKKQASKYIYEYTRDTYDRVSLLLPKGTKEQIKQVAGSESVNAWIADAVADKLKKHDTRA